MQSLVSDALRLACKVLRDTGDGARKEIRDEHVNDISTAGDREVSGVLIDFFRASAFPALIQSEESGSVALVAQLNYTVVIDDIDGTDNFFRGDGLLPYCTIISILAGLNPKFSDTVAAGIIEHRSGAMWLAEKGKGCLMNGAAAHTSTVDKLNGRTLIAIDHYGSAHDLSRLSALHSGAWIKDFGSAGFHLAGVASGMFDAFVTTGQKGHEIAAGYLLVAEAGGTFTDFDGYALDAKPFDFEAKYEIIAAGNQTLARLIGAALHSTNSLTSSGGIR